jgi:hypothetical protein
MDDHVIRLAEDAVRTSRDLFKRRVLDRLHAAGAGRDALLAAALQYVGVLSEADVDRAVALVDEFLAEVDRTRTWIR